LLKVRRLRFLDDDDAVLTSTRRRDNGFDSDDKSMVFFTTSDITFSASAPVGNESVPIQLAQCWFPGLVISDDFANKIYGSNFSKLHSKNVIV